MKTTFFAILASAAVVLASPLPEAEADAHQGQPASYSSDPAPAYGGQGGNGQYDPQQGGYPQGHPQGGYSGGGWPQGGQGQWSPPAPPAPAYGGGQPPRYPNDPSYPQGGISGSIIQGGGQGGWAPAPPQGWGVPQTWGVQGGWAPPPPPPQGGYFTYGGVAPPPQFGYQSWPAPGGYPAGSPFNNGGVSSFGNTCSNSQQAVSCCSDGGDSSGLLGGILPSSCTLNLLDESCSQSVQCCDTQTQNGLVNIGLQCSSIL